MSTIGVAGRVQQTEIVFVAAMAILGWFFSRQFFVQWLNHENPVIGLLAWYAFMGVFIFVFLAGIGVRVGKFTISHWGVATTLGSLLTMFGFWMIMNWDESQWSSLASGGTGQLPNTLLATEDGIVFYYIWPWTQTLHFPQSQLLIYIPFIIVGLFAGLLSLRLIGVATTTVTAVTIATLILGLLQIGNPTPFQWGTPVQMAVDLTYPVGATVILFAAVSIFLSAATMKAALRRVNIMS